MPFVSSWRLLPVLVAVAVHASAQVPRLPSTSLQTAAFLAGCWRLERSGLPAEARVVEEQWMAPAGGLMLGVGRTVAKGRAVEYEFMRIEERDGRLVFIGQPSGQAAAEFASSRVAPGELVFENPLHDFPQRVEYRSRGADRLEARVEGTVKGQVRAIDFPYMRVACD
jgi:hypothetical protein